METFARLPHTEAEKIIGGSTLECARFIIKNNPEIAVVNLHAYQYVPHQKTTFDKAIGFTRQDFLETDLIETCINSFDDTWNVALDSRLTLENGKAGHFALMDLAPRKSPEALEKVRQQFGQLVPEFGGGFIIETRKSYQFFGKDVLTPEK